MKTSYKVIAILSAAFFLRIFLILLFKSYTHPETWEFEQIVNNMLEGKGFLYYHMGMPFRSVNTPLYSFLSAGIHLITGHSYFAILVVQAFFSVALAYLVIIIGRILFNENVGIISGFCVAFHPGFIYYDVFKLVPLSIDSFFIALVVFLLLKFSSRMGFWNMFLIGTVIGLGTLSRGIIGAMLPFLIVYAAFFSKNTSFSVKSKAISALIIGTFIVLSPWIVRNYIIHKDFFLVSTTSEAFWRGNNKLATGTCFSKDKISILTLWPQDFQNKIYSLNEIQQKKLFMDEARRFIRENPRDFIRLYFRKLYYFWWFSPQSGIIYPRPYLVVYKYIYSVFLVLFILGVFLSFAAKNGQVNRKNMWLVMLIFICISCSQSLFYVEGRHRWLVEPFMVIFFVYGMLWAAKIVTFCSGHIMFCLSFSRKKK